MRESQSFNGENFFFEWMNGERQGARLPAGQWNLPAGH